MRGRENRKPKFSANPPRDGFGRLANGFRPWPGLARLCSVVSASVPHPLPPGKCAAASAAGCPARDPVFHQMRGAGKGGPSTRARGPDRHPSSPVSGLRPTPRAWNRTEKKGAPEGRKGAFTCSPSTSASDINFKAPVPNEAARFTLRDRPTSRNNARDRIHPVSVAARFITSPLKIWIAGCVKGFLKSIERTWQGLRFICRRRLPAQSPPAPQAKPPPIASQTSRSPRFDLWPRCHGPPTVPAGIDAGRGLLP